MRIRHLLIDARGCAGPLDDAERLMAVLKEAAASVGAHEYGSTRARYVPHGVTVVLILAESHMLLSTWPEHGLCLVEILLCNEDMEPETAWAVLKEVLQPAAEDLRVIERGVHA